MGPSLLFVRIKLEPSLLFVRIKLGARLMFVRIKLEARLMFVRIRIRFIIWDKNLYFVNFCVRLSIEIFQWLL